MFCVLLAACAAQDEPAPAPEAATAEPADVTPADFQRLRWLEGHWRGSGGDVPTFFESYRFVSDTAIQALMYADSTLTSVVDSSLIVLSGNVLTSRSANSESTATEIGSDHVRFELPAEGRSFTWTRESDDAWRADLAVTILGQTRERTYQMERIQPPAGRD